MSKPDENQSVELVYGTPLIQATTVDPNHEGEDGMGVRSMMVGRYEEIRRRLAEGRSLREIARVELLAGHGARWRTTITRFT